MQPADLIPHDHVARLNCVIDRAWQIFQSQFIYGRHEVLKEAPFQHQFASILSVVGTLYCLKRSDVFFVDLEKRCENIRGKMKFIDIICSFPNAGVAAAIELKFKTAQQGAQDHGRIDAYVDIEAVEHACKSNDFALGRFYMITDSSVYVNASTRGVGTVFCLHDGHQVTPGKQLCCPQSKGREDVVVTLDNPYVFEWHKHADQREQKNWYFLELRI